MSTAADDYASLFLSQSAQDFIEETGGKHGMPSSATDS